MREYTNVGVSLLIVQKIKNEFLVCLSIRRILSTSWSVNFVAFTTAAGLNQNDSVTIGLGFDTAATAINVGGRKF